MVISHNIQAMNTNRIANENIELHGRSTEKVSSGYKINHVGDNPVGIAMSETMRRQIRGLNQGIENTKAAINFCQVADGALNEVTEMLQRINELAVKAENGTNLDLDRHYIQAEVDQLLTEIDRVADVTTFNEIPIFRGAKKEVIPVPDDSSIIEGDIPFEDFVLAPFILNMPFKQNSGGNIMNLKIAVDNPDSPANGNVYDMKYWYEHMFRLSYAEGDAITEKLFNLASAEKIMPTQTCPNADGLYLIEGKYESDDLSYCQRTFICKENDIEIEITQKVTIISTQDETEEKKYNISYSFANTGKEGVSLDFVSYADTIYANSYNDCGNDNYYVKDENGNESKLKESYMFTDDIDWYKNTFGDDGTGKRVNETIPDSFSIFNENSALAFSQKLSFEQNSMPSAVMIGNPYQRYSDDDKWKYEDHYNYGGQHDWGFYLYWNREIGAGSSSQFSFNYGIAAFEQDDNIPDDEVNKSPVIIGEPMPEPHYDTKSLWIQTGNEKGSGLWLEIDEMNTEVLGIDKIDLTTIEGAADANTRIKEALHKLAISRSKIGAQQNRLEHTVVNEENIVEKVTASESLIRDTDLASEMVRYTNLSVLLQMGQNMIAQADQRVEKILTILQ